MKDDDDDKKLEEEFRKAEMASDFVQESLTALRDAYEKMFPDQGFIVASASFPDKSGSKGKFITCFSHSSIGESAIALALFHWAQSMELKEDDDEDMGDITSE